MLTNCITPTLPTHLPSLVEQLLKDGVVSLEGFNQVLCGGLGLNEAGSALGDADEIIDP